MRLAPAKRVTGEVADILTCIRPQVRVGAALDQQSRNRGQVIVVRHRMVERRPSFVTARVDLDTVVEQGLYDRGVAEPDGDLQRRMAVMVEQVRTGSAFEQQ